MYTSFHVKCVLLLSDFKYTWIWPTGFIEYVLYKILGKPVQPESSCSLRTDKEKTNGYDEAKSRFSRYCANAP
jgi:hypothetical protein